MDFETLRSTIDTLRNDDDSAWSGCVKNQSTNLAIIEISGEVVFAPMNYVSNFLKTGSREKGSVRSGTEFKEVIDCLKAEGFSEVTCTAGQDSVEFKAYRKYYHSLRTDDHCNFKSRKPEKFLFWVRNVDTIVDPQDLTREHIIKAMDRFKNGEEPRNFRKPKNWYVEHPETKELFPLKGVYGLATGRSCSIKAPGGFRTGDAKREFKRLDLDCVPEKADSIAADLQRSIEKSRMDTSEARCKRIAAAPKKPSRYFQTVTRFHRNPDVVTERLDMAQGICGKCHQPAPFNKKKNGEPFLEVHHVIPLANNGEDTVENTLALCPNCHRKVHDRMAG